MADRNAKLRNLLAGYSDSIRLSDIKANIAVLFVAIVMGTVLQFRDFYPWYLSLPVIMAPFIGHILEPVDLCLPTIPSCRSRSLSHPAQDTAGRFHIRRGYAARFGVAARTMRFVFTHPLVEKHHFADRVCRGDGHPRGRGDSSVCDSPVNDLRGAQPAPTLAPSARFSLSNRASISATIEPSIVLILKSLGV